LIEQEGSLEYGTVSTNQFPPAISRKKWFTYMVLENEHPTHQAIRGQIRAKNEQDARVKLTIHYNFPMTIMGVWDVV